MRLLHGGKSCHGYPSMVESHVPVSSNYCQGAGKRAVASAADVAEQADGRIYSDLAGFKWLCKRKDESCEEVVEVCEEPDVLDDPDPKAAYLDPQAQVHHVVPMNDKRSCSWGTNSNKNAAVISRKLNMFLSNKDPPPDEVKRLNDAQPYTP